MDIRQCRHFVAIVENGSYSRAAEAIPLSQPALTRSIQNLEMNLGATLLDRSTRGLNLTEAGKKFYARAKFILREIERTRQEVISNDEKAKSISLGIAPLFAGTFIPEALKRFHQYYPDVEVHIKSELFPKLISGITQGKYDLGFSNLPFSTLPESVEAHPLIDIEIVYLASQKHPLARAKKLSLPALSEFPWAVVDEQHANALYDYIFTQAGMGLSPLKIKTNSLTLLKSLIATPPYITLLPIHKVSSEIERGDIVKLHTKGAPLTRKGGLIYRKERIENSVADALMDALKETCS